MPKTVIIECEVCNANITKASMWEVNWVDPWCDALCRTLYFCGHVHMYQYLDEHRPKDEALK